MDEEGEAEFDGIQQREHRCSIPRVDTNYRCSMPKADTNLLPWSLVGLLGGTVPVDEEGEAEFDGIQQREHHVSKVKHITP